MQTQVKPRFDSWVGAIEWHTGDHMVLQTGCFVVPVVNFVTQVKLDITGCLVARDIAGLLLPGSKGGDLRQVCVHARGGVAVVEIPRHHGFFLSLSAKQLRHNLML